MKKVLKTIDLFAGVGGIRLGFELADNQGIKVKSIYANDFDEYCKHTYDLNFLDTKLTVADITKIKTNDIPDFDFLLAGFPCQAFSIAGYRKGFEDKERGNLFFEIVRILREAQPRGFLLENVKNLKGHDKGNTFRVISETLSSLGYYFKTEVLNTMNYGNIPQNRERIYIVGFKSKEDLDNFEFPDSVPLAVSFRDLLEKEVDQKYYYNNKPLYDDLKDLVSSFDTVYQWRRVYVRANKKGVCPTLTANMGTGGHNVPIIRDKKGIRKLTPKECSRIQGFPANYKLPDNIADSRLYKQFGNSVSVPVVKRVAENILTALSGKRVAIQTPRYSQLPLSDSPRQI